MPIAYCDGHPAARRPQDRRVQASGRPPRAPGHCRGHGRSEKIGAMDGAHFPSEAGPRTSSGPRAGFWQRFAAALVDGIIVGATSAILYIALENAGEALG